MRAFRNASIRVKLMIILALAAGVAVLLACGAFVVNDISTIRASMARHLSVLAEVMGANVAASLTFDDPTAASEVLASLRREPMVAVASVYRADGAGFASYSGTGEHPAPARAPEAAGVRFTTHGLDVVKSIRQDREAIGTIYIHGHMAPLHAQMRRHAYAAAAVVGIALCVSVLVSARLQRLISGPILRLVRATEVIADQRDYSVRVDPVSSDELGTLCGAFNAMLAKIQERDAELKEHRQRCRELGTAAYLTKPVKQADLHRAVAAVTERGAAEDNRGQLVTRHTLREAGRALRILLAEDNPANQKVACRMIEKLGHTVAVAGNGQEAVEMLERHGADLVLMDVQMPQMNGLEATRSTRRREQATGAHVPISAMTAHAMKGDREICLAAGMDEHITKPVSAEKLAKLIERLVHEPPSTDSSTDRPAPAATAAGAAPAPPAGTAINTDAALRTVDGDVELLRELLDLFFEDYPEHLRSIREAVEHGDTGQLGRAAHTLKGAAAAISAERVREAAFALERVAKTDQLDEASVLLDALGAELAGLEEELKGTVWERAT